MSAPQSGQSPATREIGQKLDQRPVSRAASDENPVVPSMAEDYLGSAPLGWRVVIDDLLEEEVSAMGLHVPENSNEAAFRGRVKAVGLMALDVARSYDLRIGDVVDYAKYGGVWHTFDMEGKTPDGRTIRFKKRMLYISVNDIIANLTHAERIRRGEYNVRLCSNTNGSPFHYLSRKDD